MSLTASGIPTMPLQVQVAEEDSKMLEAPSSNDKTFQLSAAGKESMCGILTTQIFFGAHTECLDYALEMLLMARDARENRDRVRNTTRYPLLLASNTSCDAAQQELESYNQASIGLDHLMAALQNIAQAAQRSKALVKKEICNRAYQLGMQSLPEALLARIMKAAFDPTSATKRKAQFPLVVSQVNRQFRKVALNTPLLWSAVSNTMRKGLMNEYLRRSQGEKLAIFISLIDSRGQELYDYLESIIPCADRWGSLECIYNFEEHERFREIEAYLGDGLMLSSLTSLSLSGRAVWTNAMKPPAFITSLIAPSLSHFEGTNAFPSAQYLGLHGLRHLFMTIGREGRMGKHDPLALNSLLSVLQNTPQLEELSLVVHDMVPASRSTSSQVHASLPALQTLSIALHNILGPAWLLAIFNCLYAPNINTLSLKLDVAPTTGGISASWEDQGELSNISPETLDIVVNCDNHLYNTDHPITLILKTLVLTRLTRLNVKSSGLRFTHGFNDIDMPVLRALRLENCGYQILERQGVLEFVERMRKQQGYEWNAFEKLSFVGCHYGPDARQRLKDLLGSKLEIA